jgi:hypothetical protein
MDLFILSSPTKETVNEIIEADTWIGLAARPTGHGETFSQVRVGERMIPPNWDLKKESLSHGDLRRPGLLSLGEGRRVCEWGDRPKSAMVPPPKTGC